MGAADGERGWVNLGANVRGHARVVRPTWGPAEGGDAAVGVRRLREAVGRAAQEGGVRAHGRRWSFSGVLEAPGAALEMEAAAGALPALSGEDVADGVDPAGLLAVWGGTRLAVAAREAERRGRSLPVTNGRGGVTVAGALQTGSHGAAIDRPPLADFVRGVLLVVSGDRTVWVERASAPAMSAAWVARLGAERVRDDDALDAAVVGLGCFGVVGLVVLEVEAAFDVDHHWLPRRVDDALLRWVGALDGDGLRLPRGGERPYHANLVINPHRRDLGRLSVGYFDAPVSPPSDGLPPAEAPMVGPWLVALGRRAPCVVGPVLEALVAGAARPARARGRLGTVFPDRSPSGYRPISLEVAVPLGRAAEALQIVLTETTRRPGGYRYPGFLAVRWMRSTRALLGFTRFDRTATLELPAMAGFDGTEALHDRLRQALAGLPFVEHPGQANAWSPRVVATAFGDRVARWRAARSAVLGADAARFENAWARAAGVLDSAT